MKKTIINILSCIVVLSAIVLLLIYLGEVMRPTYNDISVVAVNTFQKLPEDSVEVIIFGSSHAWRGVDSMEMYKTEGIGAYNYGCNWQHLNTTELFISNAMLTQKPKVALVEMYRVGEVLEDSNPDGEIYYTRSFENTEDKQRYLRTCFGDNKERYLAYYLPFALFHRNWEDLSDDNFYFDYVRNGSYMESMGYYGGLGNTDEDEEDNDKVRPVVEIPNWHEFWQQPLSDKSREELDRIMDCCNQNNTKVIFFTLPGVAAGEYIYGNAMKEYAEENGAVYLDFYDLADEAGLDGTTDFSDAEHLNRSGAGKIARYLAKYIKENYEVTDFRTIEGNLWERTQ